MTTEVNLLFTYKFFIIQDIFMFLSLFRQPSLPTHTHTHTHISRDPFLILYFTQK